MIKTKADNIIVTGGYGFIGSHLCKLLISNKKNKVFFRQYQK